MKLFQALLPHAIAPCFWYSSACNGIRTKLYSKPCALRLVDQIPELLRTMYSTSDFDNVDILHYKLGLAFCSLGRIDKALKAFQDTCNINPDFPAAHHYHAICLHANGQYAQAQDEFYIANQLDPRFSLPLTGTDYVTFYE